MEMTKNNSSDTLDELYREEIIRRIPVLIFLHILCLIGIAGNSLVLYIFKKTYVQSTFRIFVIFLSAVDLFACTFAIPLEIITLTLEYKIKLVWFCKLYPFILSWPTITSILVLLGIATDRFRKVCTPFSWQISNKIARNICISSVLLSIGCSSLTPVTFGVLATKHGPYNVTTHKCEVTEAMKNTSLPVINNAIFALIFVGALTGIIIMYSCIAVRVKQQIKRKHEMTGARTKERNVNTVAGQSVETTNEGETTSSQKIENETSTCNITLDSGSTEKYGQKTNNELQKEDLERKQHSAKSVRPARNKQQNSGNRTTLVMFMVSSVFFLSYLPSVSLLMSRASDTAFVETLTDLERSVYKFFFRFYLLNCVINPIIYGVFDPQFRNSCKKLFSCRRN